MEFEWGDELPTLPGERVELRSLRESDVADLFEIYSDREVMRYWSSPPHERREQTEQLVSEIHHGFRIRRLFEWGITRLSDDRLIGTVTLFRVDEQHRRAEIGYALARSAWGMGYVTEALSVLIRFAFEEMGLHRLEADADPRNERSLKALARQGFRREGTQFERYWLAGEIQDAALLGLLRDHWPPRNTAVPSIPPGRTPRSSIIGSWDLYRWSALLNDGTEVLPFGERCRGRLCYDTFGQMSLQIVKEERPVFESGDPFGGTTLEITEAFHGSIAYFGRYSVDVEPGIVRHHIEGSSFPNWIGTVQERRFEVDGQHLTLTAVAANVKEGPRAGAHHTLRWGRLDR